MPNIRKIIVANSMALLCSAVANPALAESGLGWSAIDFSACPLTHPLRVADSASASHYSALQGCAARIVAAPRATLTTPPDVARIIGVKAPEDKSRKGGKRKVAEPAAAAPAGTRAIAYMPGSSATVYDPHILAAAQAYRIDPLFLHAIIGTESTYKPVALSHAGARGLMQIMPDTGSRFGVAAETLYDPATNIDTGARLLKTLQARYGRDFNLILAAYNAGEGAVARYGNRIPPYRETQDYVVKVMGRYAALRGAGGI
ncbi:lytic transglycosylase domain-containing protein [Sphingobium aromaticiconvertens]|uniref:lytic transglycosylase domain-containing protein n=1 Tax=Sphingobium aromaticiconvertens TaxID=365341 RepID=UPI00301852F4